MLKGCQRKIIMLKETGSDIFEEAYFVLRSDADVERSLSELDMVSEAQRIVEANSLSLTCSAALKYSPLAHRKRAGGAYFGWFLAGCAAATSVIGIFLFIM